MYVLTYNDKVFLGPMIWHPRMFQSVIEDDYSVVTVLPLADPGIRYDVDANIIIRPVEFITPPVYNSKIKRLAGPFWVPEATKVVGSYTVEDLPIDAVKNQLKAQVAATRWELEQAGITMNIQGNDVFIDTSRDGRNIFIQSFQLGVDVVNWKFNDTWLTLSNVELGTIVTTGIAHVQAQFDWEATKVAEIDGCVTLLQLDAIILEPVV